MKACYFYGKESVRVEEAPKPSLPQGGAVVKVLTASICGTDLRSYRFGNPKLEGSVIGHEACFRIEELDGENWDFSVGDRIIIAPALGCGKCRSCLRGRTNMCDELETIGFEYPGTFAEYMAVPARAFRMGSVIKLPAGLSDAEACVVEPAACAVNAQSFLHIGSGDSVLIYGAGYLGCIHAELALLNGAEHVILCEVSEKRIAQAKRDLKGIDVLDSGAPDFMQRIDAATGGAGIDVVITACPVGATHRQALEILNKSGRLSLFGGLPGDGVGFLSSNIIHYKEIEVFGSHASTAAQNRQAMELFAKGKIRAGKYTAVFALDRVEDAFRALMEERVCKALLKP